MTTTFSATTSEVTTAGPRMSALLLGGSLGTRVIHFLFFLLQQTGHFLFFFFMIKCDPG
jgi:hypothetical protein